MLTKIPLDKEKIIQLYHTDNLTMKEVAERFGVHKDTIRKNMRIYGIPSKPSEIYRKGQDNIVIAKLAKAKELYFENKLSLVEVCQAVNMSFYTLKRLFANNNLEFRNASEVIRLAYDTHPRMGFKKGNMHPRFNGYRTNEMRTGYIRAYAPGHHRAGINGYLPLAILIWEDTHKMPLPDDWIVHHLNGIKNDNRPENLAAMPSGKHRYVLAEIEKRIRLLEAKIKDLESNH